MNTDDTQRTVDLPTPQFLIVGIGASAGGIQALKEFFEHVPADSGIAYVVILHLSPDHDSQLAEILQTVAPIPVTQVTERVRVVPNHVYVIPPNQHLMMIDGDIAVSPNISVEERRAPVDIFFRTLAESHDGRSVAVVLSGTGANGSMGLKRVKERGGAVFVQNPSEAEWGEMPRNALATGFVDNILPIADIPARIVKYSESLGTIAIPVEAEQRPDDQQHALREIFTHLRLRTGHDFSNYKRPTLLRRIERRISVRNLPDLPAYAIFLRDNPNETQALLKDLLISVTNFFRDRQGFETVEYDILPRIFNDRGAKEAVRVWVVGCATGEEAYSLAMLIAERTLGTLDAPHVQIFATDIDEAALAHAREGLYTVNDAADISSERLQRFFIKEGDSYRVRREIREMVLFANHNVLKDAPFSHLDLVSCRNVLIYLNQTAQERVMATLHFALNPGGYLFLGTSETPDGTSDLYTVVNREQHIYQSRQTGMRLYPVPESVPTFRLEAPRVPAASSEQEKHALERISYGDLHQRLLEQYAPPSLVVNEEYDIVHLSEHAGRYLQFTGGEPSNNLLKVIRPELRLELRSALYQAVQRQTDVEIKNLPVRIDEHAETVNIRVRPVVRTDDPARGFILVLFEQSSDISGDTETLFRSDETVAQQLEQELLRVRAQLRASNEQHEFQAEELKASNEELQAINEELRSAAEELETSREELQSINEELRTVNQELKVKVEETTLASNNLQNLVNSTNIGTIFLDRSFRVVLFTPAARELFNLIPADYRRPLSDITNRLANVDVVADAESVLNKLQPIEREVQTSDNKRVFLMSVLPYRTAEDRINGIVLTFVDITKRKRAEEALATSEEKYRTLFNSMDEGYFLADVLFDDTDQPIDIFYLDTNPAATRMVGSNYSGQRLREIDAGYESYWYEIFGQVARTGESQRMEQYAEPDQKWYTFYVFKVGDKDSRRIAVVFQDITERKAAEAALQRANEELETHVQERTVALQAEIDRRIEAEQARQTLLRQLVAVQEQEQQRIARDLHDQFGQNLTALRLGVAALTNAEQSEHERTVRVAQLQQTMTQLDNDVIQLARNLRPIALDDLGLVAALQEYLDTWSRNNYIPIDFHASGVNPAEIPTESATALYRVVQEALTNVLKHAQAQHVSVLLSQDDNQLRLIVEDDGHGFDPKAEETSGRLGLLGMRERVELVGGTLTIESNEGSGTTLFAHIPM